MIPMRPRLGALSKHSNASSAETDPRAPTLLKKINLHVTGIYQNIHALHHCVPRRVHSQSCRKQNNTAEVLPPLSLFVNSELHSKN
ncbi:hypothetical protein Scep_019876 [Stephania cephalantha]|uniref:Uncharacterized protein n=1 Tax=Stephania cephalantha TaxID=152367 RepID=A0AAP0NLU3_9MAGN